MAKPKSIACKRCKTRKDFTKKYFGLAAGNRYGLQLSCRTCVNKRRRKKR